MIDTLPPLREVIATHELAAKKSLGQNFLCDLNLTSRIAKTGGAFGEDTIIEIGPGPGGLTRAILAAGAKKLIVIERDERCLAALNEIKTLYPTQLEIISGDALTLSPKDLAQGKPFRIIANLPYNIATPLVISWLKTGGFSAMTLMFQKEVAQRICAKTNDEAYGRLAVIATLLSNPKLMFDVHPSNFVPPPKITSSIVHFFPLTNSFKGEIEKLERVTQAAFGQRRKMLRQSLKGLGQDPLELLSKAGIAQDLRAETLSPYQFQTLSELI
jgi:16S rRNA (adenine1518-N6/adenine1519-N6)-dimethyltransferase